MLTIANTPFVSRLLTGTGKFSRSSIMLDALASSGTELVTLALRRLDRRDRDTIFEPLHAAGYRLLPNTSGARTAEEAVQAAQLTREAMGTPWLKLEIHPDPRYLLPDPVETLKAAERLVEMGFIVLPYVHADPVLCKRLEEAGCAAVMPLAAPIGSNQGLVTGRFLDIIIEQSQVPVIVDAGLGAPSQAAEAMERGADAVLVNTAIATATDPVGMAAAFRAAVEAGFQARQAGLAVSGGGASATSPLTTFLDVGRPVDVDS
ncbi:thiazole synthase [Saccharospirillum impatiens]|uniref:thiazole synthase n=1 Tax=Saccharospirillum impatiens TaxID=169438 RepID=UPI000419C231|nr:thiazole synthase [Saccharospirillum impatiens]